MPCTVADHRCRIGQGRFKPPVTANLQEFAKLNQQALAAIWLIHCLLTEHKRTAALVALTMPTATPPTASGGEAIKAEESVKTIEIENPPNQG